MNGLAQPVLFHFPADFFASPQKQSPEYLLIHQNEIKPTPVFMQKMAMPLGRTSGNELLIKNRVNMIGNIDSLIWSEGDFWLCFTNDSNYSSRSESTYSFHFRSATDLSHDHEEGMIDESQYKNGIIKLLNSRGKRPRKIMLDLSTNYVNLDYPADTYPLYRHYEWLDVDKDGIGNSFMLTYSDKTTHEAWIQTNKIGDIKLYDKPFQEIYVKQLDGTIEVALTKAEKVRHLNIDYALKGPWKIIYYLEW